MFRSYAVFTPAQTHGHPPVEPQRHRGHREKHRGRHRKHEGTKTQRPATRAGKPQMTQIDADRSVDAVAPRSDGGTVGDLAIADHREKARQLRTQASVVVALSPGRRAQGASVPPVLSQIGRDPGPSLPLNREEEWRGLRSSRARAAGSGHRDERSRLERRPGPAVAGRRSTAGTSPCARVSRTPICVICEHIGFAMPSCLCVFVVAMLCASVAIRFDLPG